MLILKWLLEISMKEIRLAHNIIRTLVKDRIHYPGRLIMDTVALIARCGILLTLYWYVFTLKGGSVNGVSFQLIAWSMFFYFVFSSFRLRDIAKAIMQDVQSGNVEVLFNKPITYLLYRVWWQIGSGIYSFIVTSTLGTLVLASIIGFPTTMALPIFIPTFILVFISATILTLILYGILGLLAFWIEDVTPAFWIVDKSVMILGGSYLPIALFPSVMYKLALFSPFGASQFVTHTVYESWQYTWYTLFGIQLFWIGILSVIILIMFNKARRKVSVNGG